MDIPGESNLVSISDNNDFVYQISHELRAPLTASIIAVDLLEEEVLSEESFRYLKILRTELNRQKLLLDRLLVMGRMETDRLVMEKKPVDMVSIISSSVSATEVLSKSRDIKVIFKQPESNIPYIMGDFTGLEQIVVNLLSNAIKYSKDGDTVEISIEEIDLFIPDSHLNKRGITIIVSDHGIGIPESEIPKLFTRFFRASNAMREEIQGTGIGLYIIKRIIDEHHGTIKVESHLGESTTIKVWLPLE